MGRIGLVGLMLAGSLSLGACATNDRYGYDDNDRQVRRAATGAAVGAAVGAGVGAVVDGVSPVEGAVAGAVAGGVIGAVTGNERRWIRDNRGYCFYFNERRSRVYDYNRRC